MDVVRTYRLVKTRGASFRLGPVDVTLSPGEVLGVAGPAGSGKTTLLKLVWGFLQPDGGIVHVFGVSPHLAQIQIRLLAGYLSESPRFYGWMTARQFLEFMSVFYDGWDWQRTDELLAQFNIHPGERVGELSHPSRVQLALTASLAHHPHLLILDEPMLDMETGARQHIVSFLQRLAAEQGVAIILSSRTPDDLTEIANTLLELDRGRPAYYGTLQRSLPT